MKQSSIDWMANKMLQIVTDFASRKLNDEEFTQLMYEHLQTAREMHRKEIEEAYDKGFDDGQDDANGDGAFYDDKQHYYTETFQQNG